MSINTIYLFENVHEILKLEVEISGRPHRSVGKLWYIDNTREDYPITGPIMKEQQ